MTFSDFVRLVSHIIIDRQISLTLSSAAMSEFSEDFSISVVKWVPVAH